jgi:hypothetical protein
MDISLATIHRLLAANQLVRRRSTRILSWVTPANQAERFLPLGAFVAMAAMRTIVWSDAGERRVKRQGLTEFHHLLLAEAGKRPHETDHRSHRTKHLFQLSKK